MTDPDSCGGQAVRSLTSWLRAHMTGAFMARSWTDPAEIITFPGTLTAPDTGRTFPVTLHFFISLSNMILAR